MNTPMPPPPPSPDPSGQPNPSDAARPTVEREARLEATFNSALERPTAEREAYIAQACGDDTVLIAEVHGLIAAHEGAGEFMKTDAVRVPEGEREGERIGRYKLLQQIGEGGFGSVWMAEQTEPVTRRVALKIIKLGMDTREVIARFEAERQALAMMEHPNIAKVLDAGATDKGRPFFVMELVRGMPITAYCDEAQLGTRERLALFGDVCAAINHAHQKGVIHRDIKPSNVMVTMHGDKPVVKVIDFGIAKAIHSKLTDKTLFTRFEQFIGTPVYMSPEQASVSGLDIDTRSDIYALGILLYELLTGKPPFDARTLASAGYEEMRRIIREVEPPKPSSRLSTVAGAERSTLAKSHRIEPEKLSRLVESDLDWIVMKAIEKDRARRYETANGLAQDIVRFLADEPVSATPPSAGYRFRKFARRNKAALRVAAMIAAVLIAATFVSTWQAVRATRAEKQTADTLKQVAAERDAKEKARQDAEAISKFLTEVFESPDPSRDGRTITVAETLDRAVKKLDSGLASQPWRKAVLQETLGDTYLALGLARQAIPLQEKARDYFLANFGPDHVNTLMAQGHLANSYGSVGRRDEALRMREEMLQRSREKLGPEHPTTLAAMHNLAGTYQDFGRREEALKMQEELLVLRRKINGAEHSDTISALHNMATSLWSIGRRDEALKLIGDVLALSQKLRGAEHPDTLDAMHNLANAYEELNRLDEALALREKTLALNRKVNGPEHPSTLDAMGSLATTLLGAGRLDEALKILEETLALERKLNGAEHPVLPGLMCNLAEVYFKLDRKDEALKLREETLALSRRLLGPEHRNTLNVTIGMAESFADARRSKEAAQLFEEALALNRKLDGPAHHQTIAIMFRLADTYRESGEDAKAAAIETEATTLNAKSFWGDRITDVRVTRLYEAGLKPTAFQQQPDGTWTVDFSGLKEFSDLTLLQGRLVSQLTLNGTAVSDLSPLRDFPLRQLNLDGTKVIDLTPLQGMPLEHLNLSHTTVADLTPLRGVPLTHLALVGTKVVDLQPLKGMPLDQLNLVNTSVTDLTVLRGMPLTNLRLFLCRKLTDLSPLADSSKLKWLTLPPNAKDFDFLRTLPNLERISLAQGKPQTWIPAQSSAEFWKEYDAKK